jgi:hypothetical protein
MDKHNNLNKRWYEGLLKSLERGESPEDSFKHMNAYGVRDTSEAAAAKFLQDQYGVKDTNDIKQHFEKPELLDDISVSENPKILTAEHANGMYLPKEKKILLNSGEDLATGLHELSHPYDEKAHGFYNLTDALTGNKKAKGLDLGAKGLEAAEELNKGHFFQDGIKGLAQLKRLMKGDKLRSLLPIVGGLGIGASALGIGNKAMAGDLGNAALDTASLAADMTPFLGEAKMAVTPSELGNAEIMPEDQKKFWELKQKLKP